ncbi:MAG: hypothetical protein U1E10_09160 [Bdellovibrionales bacterium]|nr:hypothetical protein [Bdellovibrionales bacterium]
MKLSSAVCGLIMLLTNLFSVFYSELFFGEVETRAGMFWVDFQPSSMCQKST